MHLDDNLRRANMTAPLFVDPVTLREMELALWADTAFLANLDIMDYSLLVRLGGQKGNRSRDRVGQERGQREGCWSSWGTRSCFLARKAWFGIMGSKP